VYKIINRRKLWATRAADAVGRLVFLPRRLWRRPCPVDPLSVRRILVIRTAYLGDVVMTLPMLKPLRQRFPHGRIAFLTAPAAAPLLEGNPYVDEVLTFAPPWFYSPGGSGYLRLVRDLRRREFDLVIEARGDIRELAAFVAPLRARHKISYDVGGGGYFLTYVVPYPGLKHKVEYHLDIARHLGCRVDGVEWGIALTDREHCEAAEMLREIGVTGAFVAVHPGSRLPLKRWPETRFAAVCDAIAGDAGLPAVLLGSPAETSLVACVAGGMRTAPKSLAGRLTLRQMAGVLGRAKLLVCNDSGPMHIAAAVKTPVVAVFGPSKSRETGPYGVPCRVLEVGCPARTSCDESRCLRGDPRCMEAVGVEAVMAGIRELLS
jgi:predicted lipopolysaccharide heptosyltransferase III